MATRSRKVSTMADVAALAGVSTATVSRVLNGKASVDPALARRVMEVVESSNYVPNGAGRALRRSRSDLWALIVPDVKNPFFTSIMESFESAALDAGHTVVLCNTKEDLAREKAYVDQMLAQQVAGVVLAATSATSSSVTKLVSAGVPVVLFDRRVRGFDGDIVVVDNDLVGQLAAEHLIEQGVRHPFVATGPETVSSTHDREDGFLRVMGRTGLKIDPRAVLRLDLTADRAEDRLVSALEACPETDGVFAANGPLTAAVYSALRRLGRRLPDDVALVGVDDDHWTTMVSPQVSVVSQPVNELGRWAARLLEAREQRELDPAKIVLEPTLLVRDSSRRR